jgi:protein SCO1/2
MRHVLHNLFLLLILAGALNADSFSLKGRVIEILPDVRSLKVELTESTNPDMAVGEMHDFRVGAGDLEIGYLGSLIKAEAVYYSNAWHLERVFPLDGVGAKAMKDINRQLHDLTASMNRREYLREGDYVPNFAMIDQHGNFLQIRELRGNAFILNFIFTRCKVATMCPASTTRMSKLQDVSSEASLENVRFVTVTFDPEFDSPGIMRSYGKNYSLDNENFHLLTSTQETVDDLLRLFGILTVEEDGTINHTMATLLIDANGRIAFRKEGSKWTVDEFLKEIEEL